MKKTVTVKKAPQVKENACFVLGSSPAGTTQITEKALGMIVRNSVCSIPGVARLTGNSLVDNLAELVGSKSVKDRSISIKTDGEGGLTVEVAINIRYGYNLPETAAELQHTIASDIFSYTGLAVSNVNVVVRDLEEEENEVFSGNEPDGDLED